MFAVGYYVEMPKIECKGNTFCYKNQTFPNFLHIKNEIKEQRVKFSPFFGGKLLTRCN